MKRILPTYSYLRTLLLMLLFSLGVAYSFASDPLNLNEEPERNIISDKIKSLQIIHLEVYPNPADEYVYLKMDKKKRENIQLEVMSFIGNKMNVSSEEVEEGLYKLNIREIPSGHYYILLSFGKEKQIKKFIKK